MKKQVVFKFSLEDNPAPYQVQEAFNLLYSFCEELETDSPEKKVYNRVLINREFTFADADALAVYAVEVAKRAQMKYSTAPFNQAPWAEAVLQNVARLRSVMVDFLANVTKQFEK